MENIIIHYNTEEIWFWLKELTENNILFDQALIIFLSSIVFLVFFSIILFLLYLKIMTIKWHYEILSLKIQLIETQNNKFYKEIDNIISSVLKEKFIKTLNFRLFHKINKGSANIFEAR